MGPFGMMDVAGEPNAIKFDSAASGHVIMIFANSQIAFSNVDC